MAKKIVVKEINPNDEILRQKIIKTVESYAIGKRTTGNTYGDLCQVSIAWHGVICGINVTTFQDVNEQNPLIPAIGKNESGGIESRKSIVEDWIKIAIVENSQFHILTGYLCAILGYGESVSVASFLRSEVLNLLWTRINVQSDKIHVLKSGIWREVDFTELRLYLDCTLKGNIKGMLTHHPKILIGQVSSNEIRKKPVKVNFFLK